MGVKYEKLNIDTNEKNMLGKICECKIKFFKEIEMENIEIINKLAEKTGKVLKGILNMSPEEVISLDGDLVEEVGIDSIEAFELLATVHEILNKKIPETLDRNAVTTLSAIGKYIAETFDKETVKNFLEMDVKSKLAEIRTEEDGLSL